MPQTEAELNNEEKNRVIKETRAESAVKANFSRVCLLLYIK